MAINSSVPAFTDALRDALQARPALYDDMILTGPIQDHQGKSAIEITMVEGVNRWGAIGNRAINEEYTVLVSVYGYARGGDDEKTISAARNDAFRLLDEVLQTIREAPSLNNTVQQIMSDKDGFSYELNHGYTTSHRTVWINIEINVKNQLRVQ